MPWSDPPEAPRGAKPDVERVLELIPDDGGVLANRLQELSKLPWRRFGAALVLLCAEHRAQVEREHGHQWVRRGTARGRR